MMKKITYFVNKICNNIHIAFFISVLLLFVYAGFCNFALCADGPYLLGCFVFFNKIEIPTRIFADIIKFIPSITFDFLGVFSNTAIILQGFWYGFVEIVLLYVAYLNLPKDKKNYFQFFLFAFLLSINFNVGFIMSESLFASNIFIVMFVILTFYNIYDISLKQFVLLICLSVIFICSYESNIFLSVFLLLEIFLFKYKKIKESSKFKKYILNSFILILFFCIVFNIYHLFFIKSNSLHNILSSGLTDNLFYVLLILLISFFILSQSFYKYCINKKILFFLLFLLVLIFKTNLLYPPGEFRILNFIIPILTAVLVLYLVVKKVYVNFYVIKILNSVLLIIFIINFSKFVYVFDKEVSFMHQYIINAKTNIVDSDVYFDTYLKKYKYDSHLMLWRSIFVDIKYKTKVVKTIFLPLHRYSLFFFYKKGKNNMLKLPKLNKFNIVYDNNLLKEVYLLNKQTEETGVQNVQDFDDV